MSLEDGHLQIMTEPVEIKMLNIDKTSKVAAESSYEGNGIFSSYRFDLSEQINVEKRTV